MQNNSNLHTAKNAKNDEFYTRLTDIENELSHYKSQFKGMVVYCNCDDARESNFFKYFSLNFEFLGLKKLIATAYKENGSGVILTYEGDKNGNRMVDDEEIKVTELQGNGDFRSEECIELLKQADIVVTNPPFSIFREYIATMFEYGKKFLIVGNPNAITYKETFKYIKEGKLWLGHKSMGSDMLFDTTEEYKKYLIENKKEGSAYRIVNGKFYARASAVWFTNLQTEKINDPTAIITEYNENDYPTYDNYNAINVDKVNTIPYDYDGVMGVPITIADKVCSDGYIHFDCPNLPQRDLKYKVLGLSASAGYNKDIVGIEFIGEKDARCLIDGKNVYARVFIQKVK